MGQTVAQFVANNLGKLINNGGVQCVAVANQYQRDVIQGAWIGTPLTFYANDWLHNYGNSNVEKQYYVKLGTDAVAQEGDLAIWDRYPTSGLPHIALVLDDNSTTLRCFTQNPGNAHIENLVKTGLAGYLRPKKFIKASTASASSRKSNAQVAKEVARGDWGNDPERKRQLEAAGYDYDTIQAIVNRMKPNQVAPKPAAKPVEFRVGQTVAPKRLVSYEGIPLASYHKTYKITELAGKRAVLSVGGTVWAAMNVKDLKHA